MNGIEQILQTGIAPGVNIGGHTEHDTVYHKAPKALKELENEPIYKHGPTRGASRIAKHFGMATDFIKSTWKKTNAKAFLVFFAVMLGLSAKAGQISPGFNFVDGSVAHASDLNGLVGNATINSTFYLGAPIINQPLTSDYLLLYSPTLGEYYKMTANNFLFGNTNVITGLPSKTTLVNGDLIYSYDSGSSSLEALNLWTYLMGQSFWTNLFTPSIATNLPASSVSPSALVAINQGGTNATTQVSNLVRTIAIRNLPCTNAIILNTNLTGVLNFPVIVRPVLVVTNDSGGSPPLNTFLYTNGDEIPADRFFNSTGISTASGPAFTWGYRLPNTNIFMAGEFSNFNNGQNLWFQPANGSQGVFGSGFRAEGFSTNFSITVYITPFGVTQ